jgi:uncharacterized membrane protein
MSAQTDLLLATAFGWLCGMRSMAGPAIVGRRLVIDRTAARALAVGAVGELLIDKYPRVPDRKSPPTLAARVLSGAATGAAIVLSGAGSNRHVALRSRRRFRLLSNGDALRAAAAGALAGGAGAALSTYATYHARRWAGERSGVPDVALGAAEDAIVYGTGLMLARPLE